MARDSSGSQNETFYSVPTKLLFAFQPYHNNFDFIIVKIISSVVTDKCYIRHVQSTRHYRFVNLLPSSSTVLHRKKKETNTENFFLLKVKPDARHFYLACIYKCRYAFVAEIRARLEGFYCGPLAYRTSR